MGYELDRLMERYGVSTPTLAPYTGAEDSAADKATYDAYKTEYMNRMRSTPMYAAPQQPSGALAAPSAAAPTAGTSAPAALPTWTTPLQTPTLTTTATPAERQFQWMPADMQKAYDTIMGDGPITTAKMGAISYDYMHPSGNPEVGAVTYPLQMSQSGYDLATQQGWLNPNNYLFRNGQLYDKQYYAHGGSVHDLAAKYDEGGGVSLANSVSLKPLDVTTGMPSSFADVAAKYARQPQPQPEAEAAPAPEAEPMPARDALYEKYSAERKEAQARAREQSAAFAKMLEGALNSPAADEASKSEMYFRLAAALGSPTKTGSFGETLGLVGSQMGEYQKTRQELEANKIRMRLEAQKYQVASAKEDVDAARAAEANYIALERENRRLEEAGKRWEAEMQQKREMHIEDINARLAIASQARADRAQAHADSEDLKRQMYEDKKAAQEQKNYEKYVDKKANVTEVNAKLDETRKLVLELADHPGLNEITGRVGQFVPKWLLSEQGRNALELYEQIVAQGGFDALSSLKREGVTLGQVSNKEGTDLRQSWAAMGRSKEAVGLRNELNRKANAISAAQKRINDAFDEHYKRTYALPVPGESASQTTPAAIPSTSPAKKPVNFGTLKIR